MSDKDKYENLITRRHLADLVGLDPQTIHRYEKAGLPVVHIGVGKIPRYNKEDAMAWMEKMAKTEE